MIQNLKNFKNDIFISFSSLNSARSFHRLYFSFYEFLVRVDFSRSCFVKIWVFQGSDFVTCFNIYIFELIFFRSFFSKTPTIIWLNCFCGGVREKEKEKKKKIKLNEEIAANEIKKISIFPQDVVRRYSLSFQRQ